MTSARLRVRACSPPFSARSASALVHVHVAVATHRSQLALLSADGALVSCTRRWQSVVAAHAVGVAGGAGAAVGMGTETPLAALLFESEQAAAIVLARAASTLVDVDVTVATQEPCDA